jgi:hypothetical protein
MTNTNLIIKLDKRTDSSGNIYYIGKLETPVNIDCSEPGVAFLIFISKEGDEQLQIAHMD